MTKGMRKLKRVIKKSMAAALSMSMAVSVLPSIAEKIVVAAANEKTEDVVVIQNNGSDATQIKNVIFMIPDGGGFPTYDIAKAVKAAGGVNYTATKQTSTEMYLDKYLKGNYTTRSNNNSVTDSAAGGTALACGRKTNQGVIGLTPEGKPMANLLEMSQLQNKATGIVVTTYTADATPGAFSAHTGARDNKAEVINQMASNGVNVVLGGCLNKRGGLDSKSVSSQYGYTYVKNSSELLSKSNGTYQEPSEELKLWGDFDRGSDYQLAYECENVSSVPTLKDMTDTSIKLLSQDKDGFFLMVEGSKIDYSNHHGNMTESAGEWIAFDEAFKVALDFASNRSDTMIVVAPDHNTGVVETPDSSKMQKVVSMVKNKENTAGKTDLLKFSNKSSEYDHSDMNVGLWIYAPSGVSAFEDVMDVNKNNPLRGTFTADNTDVANYVAKMIGDSRVTDLTDATNKLFYDVTSMGSYSNGTFTFKDYNASVKENSDEVTVNGEKKNSRGEIAIYSEKKMYVSQYAYQLITGTSLSTEKIVVNYEGKGTKEDPYKISDTDTFRSFTEALKSGETYEGKYFLQTKNLDMSNLKDYKGINETGTFAGTYNGQGHSINVSISGSASKISVFPSVSGTIYNVCTTGTITNSSSDGECSGIATQISANGKLVNCCSSVEISSKKNATGIVGSVQKNGTVYGCNYFGKITCSNNYGVALSSGDVKECKYQMQNGSTSTSKDATGDSVSDFATIDLNKNKSSMASLVGVSNDSFCNFQITKDNKIIFEGSYIALTKLTYTYTLKNGSEKTVEVDGFKSDVPGYSVTIKDDEMDPELPIKVSGVASITGENVKIKEGSVYLDTKGCAAVNVDVTNSYSNGTYTTNSMANYSIIFNGPASSGNMGAVTPSPKVTPTIAPTATATPTIAPTATPVVEETSSVPAAKVLSVEGCKVIGVASKYTYTGKKIIPDVMISFGGNVLTANEDYTISVQNNTKVGHGIIVIEGKGDYTGSLVTSFNIVSKSVKKLKYSKIAAQKYTGKKICPKLVVKNGKTKLKAKKDYTITYKNNVKKGTATIIIKGKGNFSGTKKLTFKIK